ncbi:MAG TPA: glucoamylase family protein [Candidatus Limnocylindrales bacterium]|nr:glucoamylase family protein [Candidatus Limnocylindrales bacterium]
MRDCIDNARRSHYNSGRHECITAFRETSDLKNLRLLLERTLRRTAADAADPEDLIRSELFSIERLEQHAETLAAAQHVTTRPTGERRLAPRLRDNGRVLLAAYRTIGETIREERAITPAAEWLVDNFHVVEEQIREIRDDMPAGFYRELPKLSDGPLAGYPRVFGLAWGFVAHTDSLFDPETLRRFVGAYQRVQPLTIGELWAVAITLRVVLVENLRRAADRIVTSRISRQDADAAANRLLGVGCTAESATNVLRRFEHVRLRAAFAVQLVQRLRDQDPDVTPALRWLDEKLAAQGTTADEIVREEHQLQGAMNVTVRNIITSMHLMSDVDWADLFEAISLVDAELRAGSDFAAMDFATRDRYRHEIESLARGSRHSELDVARRAMSAANAVSHLDVADAVERGRHQDSGYHLIGGGRTVFERTLAFRVPPHEWLPRAYRAAGIAGYLGTAAILTATLLLPAVLGVASYGVDRWMLALLAVLGLVPATDAAFALLNRHVAARFGASRLPALELEDGIPPELRTMVVVPTLLTTPAEIGEQIERLEVRHLASGEEDLRFALLSDWTDAAHESEPGDEILVASAAAAIDVLNQRYPPAADGKRFLLLHRRRVWNAGEGVWMGWERKRGKLHELNRLLRGALDTTFVAIGGIAPSVPGGVRYVITLDADTRLPREAARRLVGKMAHPLNRPRLDLRSGRVVDGYAVLQPRVIPSFPIGGEGSIFQRVFSGPGGIDPYASAVSDVYQDLFGEGSFTGKGIYDVDVFEAALEGRIPENAVLSHDLLEGVFARAGLVSDIEVVEEFPSRYDVAAARQHRWARGDWQLLPWIIGKGRAATRDGKARAATRDGHGSAATRDGDSARAAIPVIGRWKMLDNLRRTLSAPAAFLALAAGWMMPRHAATLWTGCVLALLAVPAVLPLLAGIVPRRAGISKRSHLRSIAADLELALLQTAFLVTLLAHQTWLMADAIVRTLLRLVVSHRRMLEWLTAAQAKFSLPLDVPGFYLRMAGGVGLAAAVALLVLSGGHGAAPVALPFVALWALSPVVAQWASRPPDVFGAGQLDGADRIALRMVARRTWRFFETFVTGADHMLPPDNFQEIPNPATAHRTSPTNLGLYLLSVAAARDFGWSGLVETVERLEATLGAMDRLERFRGHFFNWYATEDLRTLSPKYVSSVDSGNLAGHLLAIASTCREMLVRPVVDGQCFAGIADALRLATEALGQLTGNRHTQIVTRKHLDDALANLASLLDSPQPQAPSDVLAHLTRLGVQADIVADIARTWTAERNDGAGTDFLFWVDAVRASITSHTRDLDLLMPRRTLSASAGAARTSLPLVADSHGDAFDRESIPTLADVADLADGCGGCGGCEAARSLERRVTALSDLARQLFDRMEFGFLLDPARNLLSIGYQVAEGKLDTNCYDLLASEARLASFIAIAKGDLPVRHWFRLGRSLTPVDRGSALVSWSGSMFEYLMPSLVMRAATGSLLEQTSRLIVRRQVRYGSDRGVPWGVSESAYNARDLEFTYQYSNFGVPGLGLKRGLSEDVVVAPYATALATMVDPAGAVKNFARLADAGACGRYGYYEALDYTPTRLPEGKPVAIVQAYMAHHQGMTILAIANALHDGEMRTRFHADAMVQATELLLQERTPRDVAVSRPRAEEVHVASDVRELVPPMVRRFRSAHDRIPRTHLLSNGRYAVMLTAAGSGSSRCGDLAVTRWREDVTCDAWGSYVFLRDRIDGTVWSAGYQPTAVDADSYNVSFSEDRAEITRRDGTIRTTLEISVSSEADGEVRRVSLANLGNRTREIEVTSYAEIVLSTAAADLAHPAFSKLFVETEYVEAVGALLATRRPRSPGDPQVWAAHLAVVEGESIGAHEFETDRARFLGRGRTIRTPVAIENGASLGGTVGTVLDPVFSLRRSVRIPPGTTARIAFWTLIAPTRSEAIDLADKHHDATGYERAVTLAWTQAQVQLHHLGIGPDEAQYFQRLANHVLYSNSTLRPSSEALARNGLGQNALWPHGISGDLPIVLVRIDDVGNVELVRQILRAHAYWRIKRLCVDIVILNERPSTYLADLQGSLEAIVRAGHLEGDAACGTVYLLRAEQISVEVRTLLASAARVVLRGRRGSLFTQLQQAEDAQPAVVRALPAPPARAIVHVPQSTDRRAPDLEYFNGLGGFDDDAREYVTVLGDRQWTPAPWINVIANPSFGFQASVEGAGYTWSLNSHENQITPWSNDPVASPPGEVLYVRDEDSGVLWSPTALPIRDHGSYVCRHGQGYTRFEHDAHGIALELVQYVPVADPVKISRLVLRNHTGKTRRLSITAYVEWVLAATRTAASPHLVTEIDGSTGALMARNCWRTEFGERVAFADLGGRQLSWTGDRGEFLGRNGALDRPAALAGGEPLSNRTGAGLDSCAALQGRIELKPGEQAELVFTLGEAGSAAEARVLVERYRNIDLDDVLRTVIRSWDDILGRVEVRTPDRAMDILLNRWLLYQTLACRIWARAGFYQASGAYGFRDQLQDVMAIASTRPDVAREQIVRAAGRQFLEGDVQHWWMPAAGQGVRTHVSDDRLWLPYVAAHYIEVTGDAGILDERVAFLEGATLGKDEADAYFHPIASDVEATVFEHCVRAIECSLSVGAHGLPLMGGGDWNDGMNRVGAGGSGESVWLGWFLGATLSSFAPLADARGERARAAAWREHAAALATALEREAWDGAWYRRGYFDDGTPLGSSISNECRIDSIAQSWAVMSRMADPSHAALAMAAVDQHLVRRDDKLAPLFTPPFDHTDHDPGYIKGYPPGIRENGGQYTHAAAWSVIAFAELGDGDKAAGLFSLLNPILHANTRSGVHRYKVEPYVMPADVYSVPPHAGRGGWTWYTGSAGWMHRAGLEWILGLRVRGSVLRIEPCVPKTWPEYEMVYRHGSARYQIAVENPRGAGRGVTLVEIDGVASRTGVAEIPLVDDGGAHLVRVVLG